MANLFSNVLPTSFLSLSTIELAVSLDCNWAMHAMDVDLHHQIKKET